MKIIDLVAMGSRNLWRRRLRTLLTVIGVVVGTTAIVVMVSLGIGMNQSVDKMIDSMGDLTVITLNEYASMKDDKGNYVDGQNTLNEELVKKISALDGVVAVMPYLQNYNYNFKVTAGKHYELSYASLIGIDPSALQYFGFQVESGSTPADGCTDFILFGSDTVYNFQNPNKTIRDWYKEYYNTDGSRKPPKVDVLKEKLQTFGYGWSSDGTTKTYKKHKLGTVGILKADDQNYETTYSIYVSIDLMREMILEQERANKVKSENSTAYKYQTIKVKTASIKDAEKVQAAIKDMGIMTYGLSDYRKELQNNQAATQYILAGIGAMSLFVAAIGIANTMVMSIYERTKEIGVMKVLGCPLSAIRGMFLYEAAMIGFIGGVIGVGLSLGVSYMFNNVDIFQSALGGGYEGASLSVIPPWLILVAILFSTMVGLLSGYFPARRATKVSALEAIKNDA